MATLKDRLINYVDSVIFKMNDLDGRVGVGNLHTGLLRSNTDWKVEEFTGSASLKTFALEHEPDLVLFVTVNGVMLKSSQYTRSEKTLVILHPNLSVAFEVAIAYRYKKWSNGVYGVEYNTAHGAPEVTRIGNMPLHASLPVQSQIKRCMLADTGTVNYYMHPTLEGKRDDGTTALMDGTHGQVMLEIPKYYIRYESEGNVNRILISLTPFEGSRVIEKYYVSAYKASLHRPTNKLSSVVNLNADYRGGNNNAVNDANAATLLGKPVTATSRINFDVYANNRGDRWKQVTYEVRKNLYWLITIEFATRQHQAAFDATRTPEGYRKGALGNGATGISSAEWSAFNSQYPALRCGLTNEFGNSTGVKTITLNDFPSVGETRTTEVNSYRGIENFFGDVWEWTNGINYKIENGVANAYVSNGDAISNTDYLGYRFAGQLAPANGYIKEITFGEHGDILAKSSTGGSSTTYFCDYWYLGADGLRGLRAGGALNSGADAGSVCSRSRHAPSNTYATLGSRLCFF